MFYRHFDALIGVSNTGPLISAFQCGQTNLLRRYFRVIHIPQSELDEFQRHNAAEEIEQLIDEGLVQVQVLTPEECRRAEEIARWIASRPSTRVKEYQHHLPEAEAMVLVERENLDADVILLDEQAAREVVRELGLPVAGFVAILGKACLEGLFSAEEIRTLLKVCQAAGTRYSNALIEEVYRQYGGDSDE
ncbi:MAG: hypothetical protein E3J21_26640 [Anaerolineales bacterium]|nr:MAG: hypothetical protein E3J21_26640 [Anaerolineales bacterium]